MLQLIELDAQEISPFEGEPQLLGVYHRGEGLRSMHKHDSDNRQRKKFRATVQAVRFFCLTLRAPNDKLISEVMTRVTAD